MEAICVAKQKKGYEAFTFQDASFTDKATGELVEYKRYVPLKGYSVALKVTPKGKPSELVITDIASGEVTIRTYFNAPKKVKDAFGEQLHRGELLWQHETKSGMQYLRTYIGSPAPKEALELD